MLGSRIKDLREDNDLAQKDVANVLGVSRSIYSLWEIGAKTIPLKHLNHLCNYYNITMDYALNLSSKNKIKNIKQINILNRKNIGDRIRMIRKENSLTLRDLAQELNTTSSTISAYETGKTLILTVFAYQICKKYKVSLDWLCGRL